MEEYRVVAKRLVGALDATELLRLACFVRGMSARGTAASMGVSVEDVELYRASMMKKLDARRTADAVRIGLYAGVDPAS